MQEYSFLEPDRIRLFQSILNLNLNPVIINLIALFRQYQKKKII